MGIMQNDPERSAQICFFDLVDIDPVITDLSVLDIIKTVDQIVVLPAPVGPTIAIFCPGFA